MQLYHIKEIFARDFQNFLSFLHPKKGKMTLIFAKRSKERSNERDRAVFIQKARSLYFIFDALRSRFDAWQRAVGSNENSTE